MTRRNLRIKRVYEPADTANGIRVLADRLWPRGLSRERWNRLQRSRLSMLCSTD